MGAKLLVGLKAKNSSSEPFEFCFDKPSIIVGRDASCDVQLPLSTVSRNHCRIFSEKGVYFLADLASTHGTLLNNAPLGSGEKSPLRDGDKIGIGGFEIEFVGRYTLSPADEDSKEVAARLVREVLGSIGAPEEVPFLRVMNGPQEGHRVDLKDSVMEVNIGRSPECQLRIDDTNLSRKHCAVRKDWSGITLIDLGSKNGVYLNGKRVSGSTPIKDRDQIMVGATQIVLIDPAQVYLDSVDVLKRLQQSAAAPPAEGAEGEASAGPLAPPPEMPPPSPVPNALPASARTAPRPNTKIESLGFVIAVVVFVVSAIALIFFLKG